jgi:hypothetical protein
MSGLTDAIVCPSCGKRYAWRAELAGRAVKCACGNVMHVHVPHGQVRDESYDLVPEDAPARAEPAAPARVLNYPSAGRGDPRAAQEQGNLIRLTIFAVALFALGAAAVVGMRYLTGPKPVAAPAGAPASAPAHDDEEVARMIKEEGGAEARAWLRERPGRLLSRFTPAQAQRHVDRWYELGATRVLAFGGMVSTAVAVELPNDPAKRKAIFDESRRYAATSDFRPATDVGQKYLLIRLGF